MARFDMQKWQNKVITIERYPLCSPICHFVRFFFFRLTRLFHLTQEQLYGRPQKQRKAQYRLSEKKGSEANGTHYI